MDFMVVTLDGSKLSGWLNADAPKNMLSIVVTLDVSKLRGWLNAVAHRIMAHMFVTLEVSQLEMSALKFCKLRKSSFMSVMAETSQSAMGPYFAIASVGSAWYAWTAVFRKAL